MEAWKMAIALCCGIAVAQSVFLGAYLLYKDRNPGMPNFFLSILLIGLAFRIGKSLVYYLARPIAIYGVAMGAAGLWAIGPAFWLYVKSGKEKGISKWDYLHFLPSFAFVLFGWTMDMSILVKAYHNGVYLLSAYLIASWILARRKNWNGNPQRFYLFFGAVLIIWSTFVFQMQGGSIQRYALGGLVACIVLYAINFFILADQSLLKWPNTSSKTIREPEAEEIAQSLDRLFKEEKIYRRKGLTLSQVAEALDRPAYLISKTINQHHGLKFNEYVNQYRIEEVKTLLQETELNYTIEALAEEVGFSSTSSFYTAFKKIVQLTPQQFRKLEMEV